MKPLTAFPDAMLATLTVLRDRLPALAPSPAITFGTITPNVAAKGSPTLPYVLVRHDTDNGGTYPVLSIATIRVAVWHESEAQGLALARKTNAVLLSYEGGPDVRGYRSLLGPIPTSDPESGAPLTFFTVAARLRPVPL